MPLRLRSFTFSLLLAVTILLSGCLAPKGGEKSANCPDGFAFDAKTRSCLAAGRAPQGLTLNVSFAENDVPGHITLPYTDANGDQALSCEVQNPSPPYTGLFNLGTCSCSGGTCQVPFSIVNYLVGGYTVFENGQGYFSYTVTDVTGETSRQNKVNVTVTPVNEAPVLTVVAAAIALNESNATYESGVINRLALDLSGGHISAVDTDNLNTPFGDDNIIRYEVKAKPGYNASITGCMGAWNSGGTSILSGCTLQVNEEELYLEDKDYVFVVRAFDGIAYSNEEELTIRLSFDNDDAPTIGAVSSVNTSEDTSFTFLFTVYDIDTDLTLETPNCSLSALSEVMQMSACTCNSGITAGSRTCSVDILPVADFNGTASFSLNASVSGVAAQAEAVSVSVAPVVDELIAPLANIYILESNSYLSESYTNADILSSSGLLAAGVSDSFYEGNNLSILAAFDPDGGSVPTSIAPSNIPAGLSSVICLGLGTCQFIVDDGNVAGAGSYSEADIVMGLGGASFKLRARATGDLGLNYQFLSPVAMPVGEVPVIKVEGRDITIYANADHTVQEVFNALNNNPKAKLLVAAETIPGEDLSVNVDPVHASGLVSLINGTAPPYMIEYRVGSGAKESDLGRIAINIVPVNDIPIICRPTPYSYNLSTINGCPESGCVGDEGPVEAGITPKLSNLLYYSKDKGVCYRSNLSLIDKWEVATSAFIPDQEINEKDVVVIDGIKLHEGGGGDNDASDIMVIRPSGTNFSSNQLLVPDANIKFFYDNSALPLGSTYSIDNGSTSIHEHDLRIEITPVGTLTGETTITLVLDDGVNATSTSFKVKINASSAQHRGWKGLTAYGPELDRFNQNVGAKVCSFSLSHCQGGGACTGSSKPSFDADENEEGVIFYDSSNNKCYAYEPSGSTVATRWEEVHTYCPISSSFDEPTCSGASCYNSGAPNFNPSKEGLSYVDSATGKCYRSIGTSSASDWRVYMGAGSVTLSWEAFNLSGTGVIGGHNVYRKLLGEEKFDYSRPLNKTPISASLLTFTDAGTNSFSPPLQGMVYEYEVAPIINSIPTKTNEIFKKMRVVVPSSNQAFVKRDLVNKAMCTMIAASDIDSANHNRCAYTGFGSEVTGGRSYYDIKNDLIVDRYELGCNYSKSGCDTVDGACIGMSNPVLGGESGDLFYNRSSGMCFFHNGSGWNELNNVSPMSLAYKIANRVPENEEEPLNSSGLPPLVNIDWQMANDLCSTRLLVSGNVSAPTNDNEYIHGLMSSTSIVPKLPARKEQIAYSLWSPALTSSTITTREAGLSLASSPKCNASFASGLEGYSDSDTPDSSSIYSLPGTDSSGIRSVATGNSYTSTCESMFGVRDHIGNVKEWTRTGIECGANPLAPNYCTGLRSSFTIGGDSYPGDTSFYPLYNGSTSLDPLIDNFRLDNVISYCGEDTDNDGLCNDTPITSWLLKNGNSFGLNVQSFNVPMGLPLMSSLATNFRPMPFTYGVYDPSLHDCDNDGTLDIAQLPAPSCSYVTMFATAINSPSLTVSDLHEDGVAFNIADILAASGDSKAFMATGGSYADGNAAGTWAFETIHYGTTRSDVGMRCVVPLDESDYTP